MLESDKKAMLIRVGKALYGERWQTDLARDLEFPDSRRIRQWLSGDKPIPKGLLTGLTRLLAQKKSAIQAPNYIYRNSANTGWVVRFPVRLTDRLAAFGLDKKAVFCFADHIHGGRENSLKIATSKRDAVFSVAGMNPDIVTKSKSNQRSVTGLLGVVPGYRRSRPTGFEYVARWYALERVGKQEFSVSRFGMKEAFRLAVWHRQRFTGVPFTLSEVKYALRVVRGMKQKP